MQIVLETCINWERNLPEKEFGCIDVSKSVWIFILDKFPEVVNNLGLDREGFVGVFIKNQTAEREQFKLTIVVACGQRRRVIVSHLFEFGT